jgi:hypothetical protein
MHRERDRTTRRLSVCLTSSYTLTTYHLTRYAYSSIDPHNSCYAYNSCPPAEPPGFLHPTFFVMRDGLSQTVGFSCSQWNHVVFCTTRWRKQLGFAFLSCSFAFRRHKCSSHHPINCVSSSVTYTASGTASWPMKDIFVQTLFLTAIIIFILFSIFTFL